MNILLCNGKGGTGKTTMAVLLAHALAEAGAWVIVTVSTLLLIASQYEVRPFFCVLQYLVPGGRLASLHGRKASRRPYKALRRDPYPDKG